MGNLCAVMNKGVTLIELIMVIVVITILSVGGSWATFYFVRNSIWMPKQLNTDMAAADSLELMIEGDAQARGLRYARSVSVIGYGQVTFLNFDNQSVGYRWDQTANKLFRSINAGAEKIFPSYAQEGIALSGLSGKLFSFLDGTESSTANPTNVRRVEITLRAETGSGLYAVLEGQTDLTSAVRVGRFP